VTGGAVSETVVRGARIKDYVVSSPLGTIYVYNILPTALVSLDSINTFQRCLQKFVLSLEDFTLFSPWHSREDHPLLKMRVDLDLSGILAGTDDGQALAE
jgi:hypothetical protein